MSDDLDKTQQDEQDEQEQQDKINPVVKIEDAGPCKKKLEIEVPAETVAAEIEKTYKDLLEEVTVPGFRKGHVPKSVAQKRFGSRVAEEVKSDLLSRALAEVVEDQELDTIGEPVVDDVVFDADAQNPMTYTATVTTKPVVEIDAYKGLKLKREAVKVETRDIDEHLEMIRKRAATHAPVERGVKANDLVSMDFSLECEGKTLRDTKDAQLIVSGESFFGLKVGELDKILGGKKSNDEVETTLALPDNFREEEYRGKEATLKIKIKDVKEESLPELNDEWAKKLDYDDMEELREETGKVLEKQKQHAAEAKLAEQVREQLIAGTDFDLPEDLVKSQVEAYFHRRRIEMERHGMETAEVEKEMEEIRREDATAEENARKMLKGYFTLRHIADKEKIYVTEDEIMREIGGIAAHYGKSPQEMAALYEETGVINELRLDMREKKTIDFIIEKAEVEEAK